MSHIAIRADGLSKQYKIGLGKRRHDTLRDQLTYGLKSLFRSNGQASATDTIWALRDVSFELKHGEALGVIGRNGAGKSTLLKILSRITEPSDGRAEIYGRVGSLLEVGTGFHGELTGRENIYLNGAILGMKKWENKKKFDEMVAFAEIEKFIDTPVKRYSSGMYVRLAFAVAAHLEPEILIVDEVLAVGDSAFQNKCLGKMHDVAERGRTVLFVSHNMQAVSGLCHLAVSLDQGRIKHVGKASQVIGNYIKEVGDWNHVSRKQVWSALTTAPGNDKIRLRAIRLLAETDDPLQEIHLETPLRIEIEYWNLLPDTKLILNLSIYGMDESSVLEDWTAEETKWRGRAFPSGLFRTVCRIPGNLLNEGTYRVRVLFFERESTRHIYDHKEALVFSVTDISERAVPWYGRFIGAVHPKLNWTTDLIISDDNKACRARLEP